MDMAEGVVSDLLELEHGIEVYDASLARSIFVIAPVICILCDNARGSELVNHMGCRTIKYCHICMVSIIVYVQTSFGIQLMLLYLHICN